MQLYTLIINIITYAARRGFLPLPWITCNRSGVVCCDFSHWSVSRITARSKSGGRNHPRTHAHAIPRRRYLCTLQTITSRLKLFLRGFRRYPTITRVNYKKTFTGLLDTLKQHISAATLSRPRRFPGLFLE